MRSTARLAIAPDIPTFDEIGLPGLLYSVWYGLFRPKGTPKDIIGKINAAAAARENPTPRSHRWIGQRFSLPSAGHCVAA
jgi:tripartite-type tricarboxylate transporter receptor subunit TctC